MKWQIGADTAMRNELLKRCLELGMPNFDILEIVHPLKGKSQEEKEKIASEILRNLK